MEHYVTAIEATANAILVGCRCGLLGSQAAYREHTEGVGADVVQLQVELERVTKELEWVTKQRDNSYRIIDNWRRAAMERQKRINELERVTKERDAERAQPAGKGGWVNIPSPGSFKMTGSPDELLITMSYEAARGAGASDPTPDTTPTPVGADTPPEQPRCAHETRDEHSQERCTLPADGHERHKSPVFQWDFVTCIPACPGCDAAGRCRHGDPGDRCDLKAGHEGSHTNGDGPWTGCADDCPGCAADEHTRLGEELDPDPQPVDYEFLAKVRTARSGAELTDDEPDALDVDTVLTWSLMDWVYGPLSGPGRDWLLGEFESRGWITRVDDTHRRSLTDAGRARLEGLR